MAEKDVALVTGCSSGVGMHTAVLLAQKGFRVYASMRDLTKSKNLEELLKKENLEARLIPLDVQKEPSVNAAVEQILHEVGKIDVLVNNAGFGSVLPLEQAKFGEIEEIFDVNFYGAVRCIRAVLPSMRENKKGHILTVTSVGGLVGQPLNEIYCAAKFALEGLIESMAIYMEPYFNIRMTIIEPAGIKSQFVNRVLSDRQKSTSSVQQVYEPIFDAYLNMSQKRGAFESEAQTPEQVGQVIVESVLLPSQDLRVQTSAGARSFAQEKLQTDPTGTLLQNRIRNLQLGLNTTRSSE